MDIVLYVSHRVREHTDVQRIALLPGDLLPEFRKHLASSLTLPSTMVQLLPLADRWPAAETY